MTKLNKAFISFRIGTHQWLTEERFEGLMTLFEKYKGVTDEITLFTSETHAPLTLDETRRRVDILAERMKEARRLGYRVGINILATIGHHEEDLTHSLSGNYTRMTDIYGNVCRGSFCPNDQSFVGEYVKPVYEALAEADQDYIWIDDDVRLEGHKPVRLVCFCNNCLEIFEKEFGKKFKREELKAAFNEGDESEKLNIRKAWLQHNRNTIANLLGFIERVVHSIRPEMPLGFMDGNRFLEGFDLDNWAKILSGPDSCDVMWRPGGGVYTEARLDYVLLKSHRFGREAATLPEEVVCIESELESFSYQRLKKSEQFTALEAACYIAAGCTGTAFNVLSMHDEPLDEYDSLVFRLHKTRPFLDMLVSSFGREAPTGVYTGWCKDSFALCGISGEDWLDAEIPIPGAREDEEIFKIGIPVAYRADKAVAISLAGDSALAFSDEQILRMLSSGVYMDGEALGRLNRMGYQEFTGFEVTDTRDEDTIEQLVEHPLNGSCAGRYRDGRQSFWKCTAYSLKPTNAKSQVLSQLVDYSYQQVADCSMGIFENRLGGRICVSGYYPWEHLEYGFKAAQLKAIFRWLSKDSLGAYIASYHRISLWDRVDDSGRHAVALINAYLDPAENVELMLKTDREEITVYDMNCAEKHLKSCGIDGIYRKFVLPTLSPWHMFLVREEESF